MLQSKTFTEHCEKSPDGKHCGHASGEAYTTFPMNWFMYCCWCNEWWHMTSMQMPVNQNDTHGKFDGTSFYPKRLHERIRNNDNRS